MTQRAQPIAFLSAYQSLTPPQRGFVDFFVSQIEAQAVRARCTLSDALQIFAASGAMLDGRSEEFLTFSAVRAAALERCKTIDRETEVTAARVRDEMARIAFFNVKPYIVPGASGWRVIDWDALSSDVDAMAAVKKIEIKESANGALVEYKVEFSDKLAALRYLGDHTGMQDKESPRRAREHAKEAIGEDTAAALGQDTSLADAQAAWSRMIGAA